MSVVDINGLVLDVMQNPEYASAVLVVLCVVAILVGFLTPQNKNKI